jgi:hypothetical protein
MPTEWALHLDPRGERCVLHVPGEAPRIGTYEKVHVGGHTAFKIRLSDPLRTPDADALPVPEMGIIGTARPTS